MKIALAQMKMAQSMEKNYEKSLALLREAARQGADLICFPELQFGQFFPQYEQAPTEGMQMSLSHDWVRGLQEACRSEQIMAVPNVYLREQGQLFDASLLIDQKGTILGVQKMVHIAQAEQFYEQSYYTPCDDGFHVFDTTFGKIGIVVCFDRHYPESIRTEALAGADLVIVPTANTLSEPLEMFEWEIRVQAFQSSVCVAMCNRTGLEDDMDFAGESLVTDANGEVIYKAGREEGLYLAEVDLSAVQAIRSSRPYMSLRRKELYL